MEWNWKNCGGGGGESRPKFYYVDPPLGIDQNSILGALVYQLMFWQINAVKQLNPG